MTRDAAALVYTEEDATIYSQRWYKEAHEDFWIFRLIMHPDILDSWWQLDVADRLIQFLHDLKAGLRPKLVLMAPPQHGKSVQIRDFIAWMLGLNPELKVIFSSYSEDLGVNANLYLQRLMTSDKYKLTFPATRLSDGSMIDRYQRNTSVLELVDQEGSFRNTTVQGQITGFGLDLGIVDDPIKGRAEAQSKQIRDKTWAWFTDDFFLRFSDKAGMIMILTRWHVDDPAGRFIEKFPDTQVVNYTAIADDFDWSVKQGHRFPGQALFPEHKSVEFLLERKQALTQASWEALYQQHPIVVGGGIFPIDKLQVRNVWNAAMPKKTVRYWDKAGVEGGDGAYTAGVLMHTTADKQFVISDIVRGHWSALEREQTIFKCAQRDQSTYGASYEVVVEQEPGSGGKESAELTIRNLRGFRVFADKPGAGRSKEVRAEPFAAQVQGGNVTLVAGRWVSDFLEEAEVFPNGKYKDQIDAASGAFSRLTLGYTYNVDAMI